MDHICKIWVKELNNYVISGLERPYSCGRNRHSAITDNGKALIATSEQLQLDGTYLRIKERIGSHVDRYISTDDVVSGLKCCLVTGIDIRHNRWSKTYIYDITYTNDAYKTRHMCIQR